VLMSGEGTIVSTEGAGPLGANIVPQMFLQFQASALFFTTSPSSNATVNIEVSGGNTSVAVSANSSFGVASILNLSENETTTLSLTFAPGQMPSHLDIGNFTIEVTDNSSISSILPTPTLPLTISLPAFTPFSTSVSSTPSASPSIGQSSNSTHHQLVADAVGLTVGLGVGLTLVSSLGYYTWKRRRRRADVDPEWRSNGDAQGQPRTLSVFRRTLDNSDSTRWF